MKDDRKQQKAEQIQYVFQGERRGNRQVFGEWLRWVVAGTVNGLIPVTK